MDQDVQSSDCCAVCGKPSIQTRGWTGREAGKLFSVMHCSSCDSLSTHPTPTQDILDDYYKRSFSYHWYKLHAAGKRRDALERVGEMSGLLGKRVLDLGGGLGYLAEAMRQRGFEAMVYDPYANNSADRPSIGEFDTVACLHVLEHTPDPLGFLRNAAQYLRPCGRLLLAVPNAAGAGYREYGMAWVWAQGCSMLDFGKSR